MKDKIFLIACSALKNSGSGTADEIYKGPNYKISRKHAESKGATYIYILSGKFYLLGLSEQFESYNYSLKGKPISVRKEWAQKVYMMLEKKHDLNKVSITILAGKIYTDQLEKLLPITPNLPLAHKRIGEQLAWLNANTN